MDDPAAAGPPVPSAEDHRPLPQIASLSRPASAAQEPGEEQKQDSTTAIDSQVATETAQGSDGVLEALGNEGHPADQPPATGLQASSIVELPPVLINGHGLPSSSSSESASKYASPLALSAGGKPSSLLPQKRRKRDLARELGFSNAGPAFNFDPTELDTEHKGGDGRRLSSRRSLSTSTSAIGAESANDEGSLATVTGTPVHGSAVKRIKLTSRTGLSPGRKPFSESIRSVLRASPVASSSKVKLEDVTRSQPDAASRDRKKADRAKAALDAQVEEVFEEHDILVRELFHLHKFVTLFGYDPEVSTKLRFKSRGSGSELTNTAPCALCRSRSRIPVKSFRPFSVTMTWRSSSPRSAQTGSV